MLIPQLDRAGIPSHLHDVNEKTFSKELQDKLDVIMSLIGKKRVLFITGNQSEEKDRFIVAIIKRFLEKDISIQYITNPEETSLSICHTIVMMGSCLYNKRTIERIRPELYDRIHKHHLVIIDCPSVEKFEEIYGSELVGYISNISLAIEIKSESHGILKI